MPGARSSKAFAALALLVAACGVPSFGFSDNAQVPDHCSNQVRDPGETDLDCGAECPACLAGLACALNADCSLGLCNGGYCQDASCLNGTNDGSETDFDCGGPACRPCAPDRRCEQATDCDSRVCSNNVCAQPTCDDKVRNGTESDIDCGGDACPGCGIGGHCQSGTDCSDGSCQANLCQLVCPDGKADCNLDSSDGCETNLNTDALHCGACDGVCSFAHASSQCVGGKCAIAECTPPFDDCDGDPSNGCETNTSNNADNCGGCGKICSSASGVGVCAASKCSVACAPGFDDCDGDPSNGCESNQLTDKNNCGACNTVCEANHTLKNSCTAGTCTPTCSTGFSDCNDDPTDGCELPTASDPANCGGCNVVCDATHASATSCVLNRCKPQCSAGWAACSSPDQGCTTNLTLPTSCGGCGILCSGSTPFCANQTCKAQQAIAVVNSTTNAAQVANGETLSFKHMLESEKGSYRLVAVAVAASLGSADNAPVSVTYNGAPMAQAATSWSGARAWAGLYYILDADLPTHGGAYTIAVNPGSISESYVLVGNALELTGVDQVKAVDSSANTSASCGSAQPSATVGVSGAADGVVAAVALFGSGNTSSVAQATGQTTTFQASQAGPLGVLVGYKTPVVASTTVTWNANNCSTWGEVAVSFFAASHL